MNGDQRGYLRYVEPNTVQEVCHRVDHLVTVGAAYKDTQRRVRDIMDGGSRGLRALVGRTGERDVDLLDSLPAGNPMLSGLTHMSTKLQHIPDLRVLPGKDTDKARGEAETREQILRSYDEAAVLELQMPQVGLWLPGYGYTSWVLKERWMDGVPYPHMELRDTMESYPGDWGVDQQPEDIAYIRHIPLKTLIRMYPTHALSLMRSGEAGQDSAIPTSDSTSLWSQSGWAQRSQGVRIAEYYDRRGCWWVVPDKEILLEYVPNPLSSGPQFHVAKRFAFSRLQGQYDHVIGLMAMHARLTVMQAQFIQDSVHTETNVFGQVEGEYRKGRFAVNEFEPGTRVERPVNSMPFQAFTAIDRLERQLRTTARYPITDDAQSPTAWATGAGLEELNSSMTLEIRMYQTVLRHAMEALDHKRLEWTDKVYGDMERNLVGEHKGQAYATTYRASKVIGGAYRTRRKYGFMAGWDESSKLVGGLQLVAAEIISKSVMRENMDGLSDESLLRVEEQIDSERAEKVLYDTLLQMGQQGDPRAITAMIRLMPASDKRSVLEDVFFPDEAEEVPPEEEPLPEAPPGLDELFQNPQMLARMSQAGNPNAGGVQVMSEMGG